MKQTKRIMAFLMALLLTVTMLPVSVFAAETPTFTVSSASKKAGEEVTLSVDISNNPGFMASTWTVSYDTTRLEKIEYTSATIDGVTISNQNDKFLWENTDMKNIQYNGKVLNLKFKVKENAPAGDAEVTITELLVADDNGDPVNFNVVAGKVTVAEKLETLIPFTKANHTDSGAPIHDKYSGIVGLKVEGIKVAYWTEWQQGFNYQNQGITIFVDAASKDDTATLSLVLKEGQAGSGSIIETPATVKLNNGEGSFTASYMRIGTGGLAPMLHIPITFKLACTEHDWDDATCKAPKTCTVCGVTEGEPNPDAHEWDEGKVTTEPTCSKAGVKTFTCKHNAQHTKTEEVAVDENAHNWGEAEYTWAEDGSSCIATRVCKNNETHKETADAEITSKTVKDATCEEKGETEYTAIFDVDWAAKQTKTVADISEKGHDWGEPEYKWADDGSSCEAKRVCNRNQQHIENAEATEIKPEVAKAPTCSAEGDTRYEAIFAEDWAHDYKAITDIPVDEDAHEWGEWKVVKEASYTEEGTKKRVCKNDESHFETETIEKLVPTATEKVDGYDVAYQEGVVIVPEDSDVTVQDIKDALTDKVEKGDLKGEVVVTFTEATIGYVDDNNNFVPIDSNEYFKDGKTIDITLPYPKDGDADKNDNFEVYHYLDNGRIEKCVIKEKNDKGLVIEVDHLSPFVIAYENVDNTPNRPSLPDFPVFGRPSTGNGITIITPEDEKEEANPNTGAPVVCSFDLTAAGVVVLAATAAVLEIKRRK